MIFERRRGRSFGAARRRRPAGRGPRALPSSPSRGCRGGRSFRVAVAMRLARAAVRVADRDGGKAERRV
eukprot:19246-Pelagococcus_subviridis.AAC.1